MNHASRSRQTGLSALLALLSLTLGMDTCYSDEPVVQRKRQQQATIGLARQLIVDVLDVQLAQLKDNGLESLPVYHDIQTMRINIDRVAEDDMRRILVLLNNAQQSSGEMQTELIGQARRGAREVVVVLMAERDRLRQRLQIARIQQQLEQLLDQQRQVRSDTAKLDATPREERSQATLEALEDQRDTQTLFDQLTDSLKTARQWDTTEGRAAKEGMEQLQQADASSLFDAAEDNLAKGDASQALQSQDNILEQLAEVLKDIEAAQGLKPFDSSTALDKINDILNRQRDLLERTESARPDDRSLFDELSQQQHELHQEMQDLDSAAQGVPEGTPLLNQAKTASQQAEEKLFEGDGESAENRQQEVMSNLGQLQQKLAEAEAASEPSETADPLAAQVAQLERLDENLDQIAQQQDQVVAQAAAAPQSAQQEQQAVAESLAEESQREPLPDEVKNAVQNAAQTAEQATQTMQDQSPANQAARHEAAQSVQQAIQNAQARTSAQLQAARRAMQPPDAKPMAQSRSSSQQDRGQSKSSEIDPDARAQGGTPRPANSELTDQNAINSQRMVGDAKRVNAQSGSVDGRSFANEPWFARLPPELREAIRMRGRRRPPRGYEERLRRYFESVDK